MTKVSSIAIELTSSCGTFSSIAIELKIDGQRALRNVGCISRVDGGGRGEGMRMHHLNSKACSFFTRNGFIRKEVITTALTTACKYICVINFVVTNKIDFI